MALLKKLINLLIWFSIIPFFVFVFSLILRYNYIAVVSSVPFRGIYLLLVILFTAFYIMSDEGDLDFI
jgi:hypothetical protein